MNAIMIHRQVLAMRVPVLLFATILGLPPACLPAQTGAAETGSDPQLQAAPGRWINSYLSHRWIDATTLEVDREDATGGRERLTVDALTGEISVRRSDATSPLGASPGPAPASENGGGRMSVQITNRSGVKVQLHWVTGQRQRVSYGVLQPGETRSQSTFAGHSWEFTPADTKHDEDAKHDTDGKHSDVISHAVVMGPGEITIPKFQPRPTGVITPQPSRKSIPTFSSGTRVPRKLPDDADRGFVFRNGKLLYLKNRESSGRAIKPDKAHFGPGAALMRIDGRPILTDDQTRVLAWLVIDHPAPTTRWLDHSAAAAKDSAQPYRAQTSQRGYYLPGDPMPIFRLGILDCSTGQWIDCDLPEIDFGRPKLRIRNGDRALVQRVDRGHQRFRLFEVDTKTGNSRTIIDEASDTFIWSNHGPPVKLITEYGDPDHVLYSSQRSGFRRLYRVNLDSGQLQAITPDSPTPDSTRPDSTRPDSTKDADWLVREIVHIDRENDFVDLLVGGFYKDQDPYHRHLIRVHCGDGTIVPITAGDGDHSVQFSPDRRWVVDTYSRVDLPPRHELRRMSDGKLICELAQATWLGDDAAPNLPNRFVAKGRDGETDIWGIICGPPGFESAEPNRFPIIESIYAGPHGAFVPKRFQSSRWHRRWIDAGFVLVQIDGMGTARRGKAFHDVCWKNLADSGFPDRIAWIKAAAEKYPALDVSRVGVYGTSAGGQSAASAMLRFNDFYSAGSASCGCHDNRMDKASWNEQWMGYPVDNSYSQNSNIDAADRLEGALMLIVGDVDTNVPPESTFRFVDALIQADKHFDLIVLPGVGHTDGGAYGQKRVLEFMREHLIQTHSPTPATATR
ncbi:MAG: prolyl oligopeptidase family serine peptidase [Planctomycetota bacterium]